MNEPKPAQSRDDAELCARVEAATRPAPWTPTDAARFRAGVAARSAPEARGRIWWVLGITASAATALALLLATTSRAPAPAPPLAEEAIAESYEEQVLFAPEWLEREASFVDAELLPDDYALASALTDS